MQSVHSNTPVKTEDAGLNEEFERKYITNGEIDHSE